MKNLKNQADSFSIINKILLKKSNFNKSSLKNVSNNYNQLTKINLCDSNQKIKLDSNKIENRIITINKKHIFGLFKQTPKVEEKQKTEKESESQANKGNLN